MCSDDRRPTISQEYRCVAQSGAATAEVTFAYRGEEVARAFSDASSARNLASSSALAPPPAHLHLHLHAHSHTHRHVPGALGLNAPLPMDALQPGGELSKYNPQPKSVRLGEACDGGYLFMAALQTWDCYVDQGVDRIGDAFQGACLCQPPQQKPPPHYQIQAQDVQRLRRNPLHIF